MTVLKVEECKNNHTNLNFETPCYDIIKAAIHKQPITTLFFVSTCS